MPDKNDRTATRGERTKDWIVGPDGRKVSLKDLPLVAYELTCGHIGRSFGIVKGDMVFCEECRETLKVTQVLAK